MRPDELAVPGRPNLRILTSTASTNEDARRWAAEGAPDGATVVADQQTSGRGRLERSWYSPPGVNLYLSQIVRGTKESLRLVPLLGAVATRETVAETLAGAAAAVIKWPNDVLVSDLKVAGILAEGLGGADPDSSAEAVLGIGVNLNMREQDFPADLRRPAGSLAALLGRPVARNVFLKSLLDHLDHWRTHSRRAPEDLLDALRKYCATLSKRVRVSLPGVPSWIGTAREIDSLGRLLVETDGGKLSPVEAGDVDPLDE